MPNSRRRFLNTASAAFMGALAACRKPAPNSATGSPNGTMSTTPGAPPAFGTAPDVGPAVSTSRPSPKPKSWCSFELTPAEREMAAGNWRKSMAAALRAAHRPAQVASEPSSVAPATRWNPVLPGRNPAPERDRFMRTASAAAPLPANDAGHRLRSGDATRRAGSKRANSPPSGSRNIYLRPAAARSIPSCAASSR